MNSDNAGPWCSVIIPTLDEGGIIHGLLTDLQSLRRQGVEIILVDGGSRDTTCEIARPLVDKIINSRKGRGVQLNEGAKRARGTLLWFIHADTHLTDDVMNALHGLRQHIHSGIWGRFNVRLDAPGFMYRVIEYLMNQRSCMTGIATGDQGLFATADYYQEAGGFPDYAIMEDIAMSRSLKKLSRPLCIKTPLRTSARRWQTQGVLKTVLLMWQLRLAYFLGVSPQRLAAYYSKCASPTPGS